MWRERFSPVFMRVFGLFPVVCGELQSCPKVEESNFSHSIVENSVGNVEYSVQKLCVYVNLMQPREIVSGKSGKLICGKLILLAVSDVFDDVLNGFLVMGILCHILLYLLDGIDDGGVITSPKFLPNGGHGHLSDFSHHIGGYLACRGDLCCALVGTDIRWGDIIGARHLVDDTLHCNWDRLVVVEDIPDGVLCN